MADCASDVRSLLPCPQCGRALYPISGPSAITFHCKNGHEHLLGELLRAQSAAVAGGLEVLLAEWNRQHKELIRTAEDAQKNGYPDVAAIFNRHAKSLESRIRRVAEAFMHSESSRLLKLPDAIRSA